MKMRKPWKACSKKVRRSTTCAAYPGWDQSWPPWSSARSTASSASPRLRSFVATPGCVLPPTAAGQGFSRQTTTTLQQMAPLGLRRGTLGCHRLLGLLGDFYKRKRALGKKPGLAILATARLMARITWQLLTQHRVYASTRPNTSEASLPSVLPAREARPRKCTQRSVQFPSKKTFPSRFKIMLVGR